MDSNPLFQLLHKLREFAERVHLAQWVYLVGTSAIGWLLGVNWFWIFTLVPLTFFIWVLVMAEFQYRPEGWWWPFDWPWWGSVTLDIAAKRAILRLHDTEWGKAAMSCHSIEWRIDRMGQFLVDVNPYGVLGRRLPGPYRPVGEWSKLGNVREGATILSILDEHDTVLRELRIERYHFWKALQFMRHNPPPASAYD